MIHEYGFDECMKLSFSESSNRDVGAILLREIPGATNVRQATQHEDRHGTDWWVGHRSGKEISVDTKVRKDDWARTHPQEDDLALETWSVVEHKRVGWTRDVCKRTDYILWLWKQTGRWCLVPFPMLCGVFIDRWQQWRTVYKCRKQTTPTVRGGYHSECVFVPRKVVWREIYLRYAGSLAGHPEAKPVREAPSSDRCHICGQWRYDCRCS